MKIQDLAIIFVLIILPISLVLSTYTQYQIKTLNTQTLYDTQLTSATYDAIKAYQINAENSTTSELSNSKVRDISASVSTFKNSIISAFRLNGYSEEELDNYIPALVYTMYDGFYIYAPYENVNYQYEKMKDAEGNPITDADGNKIYDETKPAQGNGKDIYGLKPYIPYSCRYIKGSIDVVITYALENYITIQGMIGGEYVNESGYLIDGIEVLTLEDTERVYYNGIEIKTEQLKEDFIGSEEYGITRGVYPYAKSNGTKYYLIEGNENENGEENSKIIYLSNGKITVQCEKATNPNEYEKYKKLITKNDIAIRYYKNAKKFTDRVRNELGLNVLRFEDAYDVEGNKLWEGNNTNIFGVENKHIENELSSFNQHRLAVIRHTIETNLSLAIANYNNYSKSTTNDFQMPKLKEDEWDYITHNISLISFLQGLHIGGKIYNGYTIVTNSESKEVVLESDIYILGNDSQTKTYHKIGDAELEEINGSSPKITVNDGSYTGENDNRSAGRLNLDFKRKSIIDNNQTRYYYPLNEYNASYTSVIMQDKVNTDVYKDIYEYVDAECSDDVKRAFYIALARERGAQYKENNSLSIESAIPEPEEPGKKPSELFDSGELQIGDFVNYNAGTWKQEEIDAIQVGWKTDLVTANGSTELPDKTYQFGGFVAGSSRNGNATPYIYTNSNTGVTTGTYLQEKGTDKVITGWRVFDIDGDNVTLISAGNPEDYSVGEGEGFFPIPSNTGKVHEYVLTGNGTSWYSTRFKNRDWNVYVNSEQKAESATVLTKSKLDSWYMKYTDAVKEDKTYKKIKQEPYIKYYNIINNYSYYNLAEGDDEGYYWYFNINGTMQAGLVHRNVGYGIRILVTLSSDVIFTATKTGTKTVTGGNMDQYGGDQTYNVWDIITE